jgi:UDP-glucose 4-epimerase
VNQSNIRGTASVLEFARVTGAKLVYSGSSTKFTNLDPNYQISPYAATKSINTDLVRLYGDCASLKYAITYFYNVFGGREIDTGQYSTVIAKFLKLRRENKPLTVTKPGSQRRNFTHINDIIDGLLLVGDIGEGDGFGIGSDISFSIMEVAQLISNDVKLTPAKPGNRNSAWLNTQKTKDLGWRCKHSLIEYIKNHS